MLSQRKAVCRKAGSSEPSLARFSLSFPTGILRPYFFRAGFERKPAARDCSVYHIRTYLLQCYERCSMQTVHVFYYCFPAPNKVKKRTPEMNCWCRYCRIAVLQSVFPITRGYRGMPNTELPGSGRSSCHFPTGRDPHDPNHSMVPQYSL